MSFDLQFSEEFFLAEGEPYDRSDLALNADGKPTSVWSAIEQKREENPEWWIRLGKEVFDLADNARHLSPEAVLRKIRETNACRSLSSPVRVYIDSERWYYVEVYS